MNYVAWAIVALLGYTFVPPLMRIATRDIPTSVATFGVAIMLASGALSLALLSREQIIQPLASTSGAYVLAAGVCITISVLAFFRALSLGPVSIVTPIFGLFLVTSSILSVMLLGESVTLQKVVGILFAIVSIVVLSFE